MGDCSLFACLCIQSVGCPEENAFKKDGWKCTFYAFAGLLDDHRYQWWLDLIKRVLIKVAASNVGYVCIQSKTHRWSYYECTRSMVIFAIAGLKGEF